METQATVRSEAGIVGFSVDGVWECWGRRGEGRWKEAGAFRGREHGAKSKNQILTGSKGVDTKISAPFSCSYAVG